MDDHLCAATENWITILLGERKSIEPLNKSTTQSKLITLADILKKNSAALPDEDDDTTVVNSNTTKSKNTTSKGGGAIFCYYLEEDKVHHGGISSLAHCAAAS